MYTIIIAAGIGAFLFLLLAVLSGLKVIKVKFKTHKTFGIIAASFALTHVSLFLAYNFF
jgi:hypothetical protein